MLKSSSLLLQRLLLSLILYVKIKFFVTSTLNLSQQLSLSWCSEFDCFDFVAITLALCIGKIVRRQKITLLKSIVSTSVNSFRQIFAALNCGHFEFISAYELRYIVRATPFTSFEIQ